MSELKPLVEALLEQVIPLAATAVLDPPYEKMEFSRDQKTLTASA